MKKFEFRQSWSSLGTGVPEFSNTMAQLEIYVDDYNLTKNENIWSQSIHKHIVVSTYPLALWILQSWWRLLYEPLPSRRKPEVDWRMAHELGAANQGFVWPKIIFASDSENVQIWASPSDANCQQSVRYLNGLYFPISIPISSFQGTISDFVSTVVNRLDAVGLPHSDLSELYKIIREEQQNENSLIYRKLEALMGFDPDECSPEAMNYAIRLRQDYGEETLSELAPIYGKARQGEPLKPIEEFMDTTGVLGKPSFSLASSGRQANSHSVPWKLAVKDAHQIRNEIGNLDRPIDTDTLFELLGVALCDVNKWNPITRSSVSVGIPAGKQNIKFVPRKRHPISKRFELSRYIGDFMYAGTDRWLINTDLSTSRQKYQRAFAAEFLCPINGLVDFLQEDFSDEAIDDASDSFNVSQQTIMSLLANNHFIEYGQQDEIPYQIGFYNTVRQSQQ